VSTHNDPLTRRGGIKRRQTGARAPAKHFNFFYYLVFKCGKVKYFFILNRWALPIVNIFAK